MCVHKRNWIPNTTFGPQPPPGSLQKFRDSNDFGPKTNEKCSLLLKVKLSPFPESLKYLIS